MNEPTQLLYTSVARPDLDEAELARVIEQSAPWNRSSGVAGAVLLHGGRLLQVLEGPAHAVQGCFRRLSADTRHEQVTLLQMGPLPEPRFEPGRTRLARVHPAFAESVSEVIAQLLQRPDAVNVEAALRLLRNLAPGG
ncbi:sensor of blue-light using FAD [Burkholderiales bacterium JOSHI_001]|nr:sensor of blue-light using FAD [Burkholderiales bacterium JOSHI_001]